MLPEDIDTEKGTPQVDTLKDELTKFLAARGIKQYFLYGISMSMEDLESEGGDEEQLTERTIVCASPEVVRVGIMALKLKK
jgi:hypothetical protein